jgi:hypothetical protein
VSFRVSAKSLTFSDPKTHSSSCLGAMPRFSIAAAAANMAQYLSQNQGGQMKSNHGALVDRTHLYWPGLQGLVANPMAWRDRLGSSELLSVISG